MTTKARVIVVGGGLAGLTAAYRLQQAGLDVTVLEASAAPGGKATSVRRDGFTLNTGATLLSGSYTSVLALADELGVADEVQPIAAPRIGFYDPRREQVNWIRRSRPAVLVDLIRTPVVSFRSKLLLRRLIDDARDAAPAADYRRPDLQATLDTESVEAYCRRRLNADIEQRLVGPLMSGLYLIDGARVSTAALWFGLLKLAGGTLGYQAGIGFLVRAIAARVPVTTDATALSVSQDGQRARVTWRQAEGDERAEEVDGVVVAVGPREAALLHANMTTETADHLTSLGVSTVYSMRVALSWPPRDDGMVVVAPHGAVGGISLVTFDHTISPGSVPSGKGLLGVLLNDDWSRARTDVSDDEIVAEVLGDLERVLPGVGPTVEFTRLTRWDTAGLTSVPGMQQVTADLAASIDPRDRVQLAGEYLTIPGMEGTVVSADQAARRLVDTLQVST